MDEWNKYKLGNIANEVSERVSNPSESGYERFVGLEHLESGSFYVNNWGNTSDVKSAMKIFKAGDILFARRNTYLKRASIATFDGICSGDIIVLRERKDVAEGLLLLIMNLNRFWDYAISNSAGTMSKRAKWRDISEFELLLPELNEQNKFVNNLFNIEKLIDSKKILKDKLIVYKNKFIDNNIVNLKSSINSVIEYKIKDICEINPKKEILNKDKMVSFITMEDVSNEAEIANRQCKTYAEVNKGFTSFKESDILVAKITPCFENGKGALCSSLENNVGFGSTEFHVIRCGDRVLPEYVFIHTLTEKFRALGEWNMTGSAGQRRVPKEFIEDYKIMLPCIEDQKKLVGKVNVMNMAIKAIEEYVDNTNTLKMKILNNFLSK